MAKNCNLWDQGLGFALAGVSAANLAFLTFWLGICRRQMPLVFQYSDFPGLLHLASVWSASAVFALLIWGMLQVAKDPSRPKLATCSKIGLLVIWVLLLNLMRHVVLGEMGQFFSPRIVSVLITGSQFCLGASALWLLTRGPVVSVFVSTFLLFFPFVLITFAESVQILWSGGFSVSPPAPKVAEGQGRKGAPLLVLLFDEWDKLYSDSLSGSELPNWKALKQTSASPTTATCHAFRTHVAIPALLTGIPVTNWRVESPRRFVLSIGTNVAKSFSEMPTLFDVAHENGYRTGTVGYGFPYCRHISMHQCLDYPAQDAVFFPESGGLFLRSIFSQYGLPFGTKNRNWAEFIFSEQRQAVASLLDNAEYDFRWVHLGLPHPPWIPLPDGTPGSYHRNLQFADQLLGEIRAQLEKRGEWDKTTVIFTSDHGWRRSDLNSPPPSSLVPLQIKLPNQNRPAELFGKVSTLDTHDIIVALLQNQVRAVADLQAIIDQKKSVGRSTAKLSIPAERGLYSCDPLAISKDPR